MKKVLLFCALALGASFSHAQLLLNENFTDLNLGNLSGQGGWVTQASNPDVQVVEPTTDAQKMIVPNYTSGTKYITVGNSGGKDPYKNFTTNVPANANTTFWISFVVRVANNSATTSTSNALQSVALRTADGNSLCYFYIADNGSNLKFGISKSEGGTGDGSFSNNNYSFNTNYLIVIRYDIDRSNPPGSVSAENNDEMYLWVNPNIAAQPTIGSAIEDLGDGRDDGTYSSTDQISALQVFQQYSTTGIFFQTIYHSAAASFDGFKVAYATGQGSATANATAAWDDLSPVGAPLPVRFTQFKAAQKGSAVQLSWTNATEEHVTAYTVERSSNGSSYEAIATVTPVANNNTSASYQYTDAAPLPGSNYYRIKAVEAGGKITYTSVAKINMSTGSGVQLVISPNPVRNKVASVQFNNLPSGKYVVKAVSNSGQVVYQERITHAGGSFSQALNLSGTKAGLYYLVVNGAVTLQKQFVLE